MNVLSHGVPFDNGYGPLELYGGPHDIRSLGGHDAEGYQQDYRYDALGECCADIIGRVAKDWPPDLLICWYPEKIPPPRHIEDAPVRTIGIASDWNLFYPALEKNLARFDVVLCDKPGVEVLANDLVSPQYLFPLYAQDSRVHVPNPVEKDFDVVYIGAQNPALRPERSRYLERLAKLSDEFRIFIGTGVEGDAYARMLSRARIIFNHSVRGELNLRVFEALACGSLLFVEEVNAEAPGWLRDGVDVVLYNEDNFEERLRHYLLRPAEAEAITARGHSRASEFAGENRLTVLIDWAAEQSGGGRRFRDLPPAERAFQDILLYGYSWLEPYRSVEKALMTRFVSTYPEEPRAWTAVARYLINPYLAAEKASIRQPCLNALDRAHSLAPASAPYAINAAWGHAWFDEEAAAIKALEAALDADSLEGADLLVGEYLDPFWNRWLGAVARKRASLGMLRAEAHVRLAHLLAHKGRRREAESHLDEAAAFDGENRNGVVLLGELLWQSGRRSEAADLLLGQLPHMPFAFDSRSRLTGMLRELGRSQEADALEDESRRIAKACSRAPGAV